VPVEGTQSRRGSPTQRDDMAVSGHSPLAASGQIAVAVYHRRDRPLSQEIGPYATNLGRRGRSLVTW
jgi:hypothetical protein